MNVICLMNDTFRRDHLGCYGNPWIKTPNLDRFAQRAAAFKGCYVASYPTVPNRWDLFTGRFGFPFRGWQPLGPDDVTLAQVLALHGVHTQMILDTPMLCIDDYNYGRGFESVWFIRGHHADTWITDPSLPIRMPAQPHKIHSLPRMASYLRNHFYRRYEREFVVARTASAAQDWLETNYSHESFFLWIDMWDPHEPFDCPWYDYELYAEPDYDGDQMMYPVYGRCTYQSERELGNVRARYAGNVTLVDRWLGQLFDTIERLGLFKNTLIIWMTDHGHLFGEHSLQGKPGAQLGSLYEVTARMPLLVHHPEGLGAGQQIEGIVQPPDILPSILECLEIPVPSEVQGKSFWPLVTGERTKIHDYAFSSRFPPSAGDPTYTLIEGAAFDGWAGSDQVVEPSTITDAKWAYVCAPLGMPSELYNLQDDPDQEHNVLEEHPQVADRMRHAWIEFLKSHGAPQARIRPFLEAGADLHTPPAAELYAFRDDVGQWIAFSTEDEAQTFAHREDAPGNEREIEKVTFGVVLNDNPRNLIYLFGQYYWAQDLA